MGLVALNKVGLLLLLDVVEDAGLIHEVVLNDGVGVEGAIFFVKLVQISHWLGELIFCFLRGSE